MLKLANILSIVFHPLFISFYNFLFFILLSDASGAVLGFDITLFFFAGVMIPIFYTFMIIYKDKQHFEWSHLSDMAMHSRRKLLAYTIIYNVVFLLFLINLHETFLGNYQPMFASVIMGFVLSMIIAFACHLLNIKNSLHSLTLAFFLTFNFIFSWKIPGMEHLQNTHSHLYLIAGFKNLVLLAAVIWARKKLDAHNNKEIVIGILIGILSPVILTLLTYGI